MLGFAFVFPGFFIYAGLTTDKRGTIVKIVKNLDTTDRKPLFLVIHYIRKHICNRKSANKEFEEGKELSTLYMQLYLT